MNPIELEWQHIKTNELAGKIFEDELDHGHMLSFMGWKLEKKEETILHNVLSLTPTLGLNILLHPCKFFHKLTDIMQLKCRLAYQILNFLTRTLRKHPI